MERESIKRRWAGTVERAFVAHEGRSSARRDRFPPQYDPHEVRSAFVP